MKIETFEWRGRCYQLETFYWQGQKRFKCPLCPYENYQVKETLEHRSGLKHRHDFYRQEQHWEMETFWRQGAEVFKCQSCFFESSEPLEVADHYSATHGSPEKPMPSKEEGPSP